MSTNNFSVQVVVSGQAVTVKVNEHQTLDHLVREALQESGNQGQSPDAWDLRTAAGAILPLNQTVEQAVITAGVLLYLNPKTSSGG